MVAVLADPVPLPDLPRYVQLAPGRHPAPTPFARRRIVVTVVVVLCAVVVLLVAPRFRAALGGEPASTPEGGPGINTYVVHPGDTLWSIARHLAPDRDPRPVVDAIASVNTPALNGSVDLTVGQILRLPRG